MLITQPIAFVTPFYCVFCWIAILMHLCQQRRGDFSCLTLTTSSRNECWYFSFSIKYPSNVMFRLCTVGALNFCLPSAIIPINCSKDFEKRLTSLCLTLKYVATYNVRVLSRLLNNIYKTKKMCYSR